jgi:hypothetical protein
VDAALEAITFDVVSPHLPLNAPASRDIGHIHVRGDWIANL